MKPEGRCIHDVVCVGAHSDLATAVALMRKKHVSCLVVVDDATPARPTRLGVLTDRDLVVQVCAPDVDVGALNVADVLARHPQSVPDERALALEALLRKADARRAPAGDAARCLAGVLAMEDAVRIVTRAAVRQLQRINGEPQEN